MHPWLQTVDSNAPTMRLTTPSLQYESISPFAIYTTWGRPWKWHLRYAVLCQEKVRTFNLRFMLVELAFSEWIMQEYNNTTGMNFYENMDLQITWWSSWVQPSLFEAAQWRSTKCYFWLINVKEFCSNPTLKLCAAFKHSQIIVVDVQVCTVPFSANSSTLRVRLRFLLYKQPEQEIFANNSFLPSIVFIRDTEGFSESWNNSLWYSLLILYLLLSFLLLSQLHI